MIEAIELWTESGKTIAEVVKGIKGRSDDECEFAHRVMCKMDDGRDSIIEYINKFVMEGLTTEEIWKCVNLSAIPDGRALELQALTVEYAVRQYA